MLSKLLHELEVIKAIDIVSIDVSAQTTITDYMIICSGRSSRHVKAIAAHITEEMRVLGLKARANGGALGSDWILVDFGDFVVHIMQVEVREFYKLEDLWLSKD